MNMQKVLSSIIPYMATMCLAIALVVSLTYGGAFNNKYSVGLSGYNNSDYLVMLFDGKEVAGYWVVKNGRISRNTDSNETRWNANGNVYSTKGTTLVIELKDHDVDYIKLAEKYNLPDDIIKDIQKSLGY
jgi:hypothetical protein